MITGIQKKKNQLEKSVGSAGNMWSDVQTKRHESGREMAALCIDVVVKLAKWRKLLKRRGE